MKSDVPPSSEQDYRVSSAIIEVAEETTISALKLITIQRGHDPRDFILLVSGGAGPKLASKLAREMSVRACVIPVQHGIFSAWGMLAARPRVDLRQMVLAKIDEALASRLSGIFDQLELEAAAYFGVARRRELVLTHTVEGRYRNQEHSVAFECPPGAPSSEIMKRMHAAHKKAFTFDLPDAEAEITTVHLQAEALVETVPLSRIETKAGNPPIPDRRCRIFLGSAGGWIDCDVYLRERMVPGHNLRGPALVEESTTTTLVRPDQILAMDPTGQLIIREQVIC